MKGFQHIRTRRHVEKGEPYWTAEYRAMPSLPWWEVRDRFGEVERFTGPGMADAMAYEALAKWEQRRGRE